MPRELTDHKVNGLNEMLVVTAEDGPGPGGASHEYAIDVGPGHGVFNIQFQKGPIQEVGVNGISHEALLAILMDRLRAFQAGPYACEENRMALEHMEKSLDWLKCRTIARMSRGVEGTSEK
jgi:hypothetical protein